MMKNGGYVNNVQEDKTGNSLQIDFERLLQYWGPILLVMVVVLLLLLLMRDELR